MSELRLIRSNERSEKGGAIGQEAMSEPERELKSFIDSVTNLMGPCAAASLTELWLDELACMECVPGSGTFNWRSVSLSASVKLAIRVVASQLYGP